MNNFKISIFKASLIFFGILLAAAALLIFFGPLVPNDKQLAECVVNLNCQLADCR